MNEQPLNTNGSSAEDLEMNVQNRARQFSYPVTPDIARSVRTRLSVPHRSQPLTRRLLWAALIIAILLCGLLSVPQVRAALLDFFKIGSVIIFPNGVTTTPPPMVTPQPTATLITSLRSLAGETTLEDAESRAKFAIRTPKYPSDLGMPDKVYLQYLNGRAVILVWIDPDQPEGVRLSLHVLTNDDVAYKLGAEIEKITRVNGERAVWTTGPYLFEYKNGNRTRLDMRWIIRGHVLIWTEGDLTYRLEVGNLPFEEALKIAESLSPITP
jgi:hypothetical protein